MLNNLFAFSAIGYIGRQLIGMGTSISAAQLHFLDGKAGRGKTFLMHCLVTQFRAEGNAVLVVGTTSLSIVHYNHSCTAHSAFGIPVREV